MQPYGVHVLGDLVSTLFIAGIWYALRPGWRIHWLTLALALSTAGSVKVLAQAITRADSLVVAYHLMWVLFGVAATVVLWQREVA